QQQITESTFDYASDLLAMIPKLDVIASDQDPPIRTAAEQVKVALMNQRTVLLQAIIADLRRYLIDYPNQGDQLPLAGLTPTDATTAAHVVQIIPELRLMLASRDPSERQDSVRMINRIVAFDSNLADLFVPVLPELHSILVDQFDEFDNVRLDAVNLLD